MAKPSDSIDPHNLGSTVLQCYWALDHLEAGGSNRFALAEITHCLVEDKGIAVSSNAVRKALARSGSAVHHNKEGYRLMEKGRRELDAAHSDEVLFIEAGQPFNAKRVQLPKVFKSMKGVIRVCDPYVDSSTLYVLFALLDKRHDVRILTQTVSDKPTGAIKAILSDLKKEGYSVEIRVYAASTLHDRYLVDDGGMWLSGNSLNYLGNKESFLVKVGDDIAQSTRAMFDSRWKSATPF